MQWYSLATYSCMKSRSTLRHALSLMLDCNAQGGNYFDVRLYVVFDVWLLRSTLNVMTNINRFKSRLKSWDWNVRSKSNHRRVSGWVCLSSSPLAGERVDRARQGSGETINLIIDLERSWIWSPIRKDHGFDYRPWTTIDLIIDQKRPWIWLTVQKTMDLINTSKGHGFD